MKIGKNARKLTVIYELGENFAIEGTKSEKLPSEHLVRLNVSVDADHEEL